MPSQIVNDTIVKTALTFGPSIRKATDRPRTVNLKADTKCAARSESWGVLLPGVLGYASLQARHAIGDQASSTTYKH